MQLSRTPDKNAIQRPIPTRPKLASLAYVLWMTSGIFAGHCFYANKEGRGIVRILMIFAFAFLLIMRSEIAIVIGLGIVALSILDLFLIPGWIRDYNAPYFEAQAKQQHQTPDRAEPELSATDEKADLVTPSSVIQSDRTEQSSIVQR